MWFQTELVLKKYHPGFHIITHDILLKSTKIKSIFVV